MKDRIYYLRKELLKKSRREFGEPIGMTNSELKNIEYGITELRENKIKLICSAYGVNEKWLRTGDGEIFVTRSLGDEIGEIVAAASRNDPEEAAAFFKSLFDRSTQAEMMIVYEIAKRWIERREKED